MNKILGVPDKKRGFIHPWIFSGSVACAPENILPGAIVKVSDSVGNFVGYGFYNHKSSIRIRLFSFREDLFFSEFLLKEKINEAILARKSFGMKSNSFRLIFSESDFLPGLIVDKFGDNYAVIQLLTAGMENLKGQIIKIIFESIACKSIIERPDCEIRRLEGIAVSSPSIISGDCLANGKFQVIENDLLFNVDLLCGQKTGFYLDQRENRKLVSGLVKPGMRILDCFSYTGGFSVYAAANGAEEITLVDDSSEALETAKLNFETNGLKTKTRFITGNAFKNLREFRDRGEKFDIVILDPPKFAPTRKDIMKASRGYKDINLLGMKLLRKNGFLASFSCSSGISRDIFRKIVEDSAKDARVDLQIMHQLGQAPDHPVLSSFPESEYLKGLICRVIN